MCLFFTTLLLGPRVAILFWWLISPARFSDAFNSYLWPLLGVIFFPWTTLMWVIVWSIGDGVYGIGWFFIALGVLADISLYAGSANNRQRTVYA